MSKLTIRFRVPVRVVAVLTTAALCAGAAIAHFAPVRAARQQADGAQSPVIVNADQHAAPAAKKHHWYQFGVASWYGGAFQGRPTASGEEFNMHDLTAAHRHLPLGTLLRVTNLRNNRNVVVRVNDRGPVPEDRIIDLSYAAAQRLSFEEQGLVRVKLEILPPSSGNLARLVPNGLPSPE